MMIFSFLSFLVSSHFTSSYRSCGGYTRIWGELAYLLTQMIQEMKKEKLRKIHTGGCPYHFHELSQLFVVKFIHTRAISCKIDTSIR